MISWDFICIRPRGELVDKLHERISIRIFKNYQVKEIRKEICIGTNFVAIQ